LIDRFAGWVLGAWLLCSSAGWAELLVLESEGGTVLISTQEVKEEGGKVLFKENSGTLREVAKKKVLKKLPRFQRQGRSCLGRRRWEPSMRC